MLEFINNVRGLNSKVPESFRTIFYFLLKLLLLEKLSDMRRRSCGLRGGAVASCEED